MEKSNTYLITGANGFIGRHLVDEFSGKDCQIRCLVTSDRYKQLWRAPNINTIVGNLLDKKSLEKAVSGVNICIHLASIMNSKDKNEFEQVNVKGMTNLIETSIKHDVKKIIYISSIEAEVNPNSLYGRTKLAAEEILKNTHLNYTILRPAVVYGRYDNKNISALIGLIRHSPIIPVIGDGEYKRQPLYVEDLIYTIKTCIEREDTNVKTYNVGGPFSLSMNEIIENIQVVLGKKRLIVHLPINKIKRLYSLFARYNRFFRDHIQQVLSIDKDKVFDITKTEKELNFKPLEFRDGLRIMFSGLNKNA